MHVDIALTWNVISPSTLWVVDVWCKPLFQPCWVVDRCVVVRTTLGYSVLSWSTLEDIFAATYEQAAEEMRYLGQELVEEYE
jgi:hypothetical protein